MAACPASQLPKRSAVDVHLLRDDLNQGFPTNAITTSKYTLLTFLPLNLMEQFRRVSNMYFLIVMVCTLIPGATSINPYSAVFPFMFVLSVAAVKDGYEDFKRHIADRNANAMPVHVLRDGAFVEVPSKDIRVGDVVRFRHGEEIRVDGLVLNSSLPDGLAYIETANLDGETNAKTRRAKPITTQELATIDQLTRRCAKKKKEAASSGEDGMGPHHNISTHPLPPHANNPSHPGSVLDVASRPNRGAAVAAGEQHFSVPMQITHHPSQPHPRTNSDTMWSTENATDRESNVSDAPTTTGSTTPRHTAGPRIVTASQAPTNPNGPAAPAHCNAHHRLGSGQFDANDDTAGVHIVCAEPNPNLALWHGKLHMPDDSIHPLSIDQFVPRGCILRNTEWVVCAALYTGNETKMMLNLRERPMKQSVMEQKVNSMNVFLFTVNQSVIFLFCGLGVRFRLMNMLEDGDATTADGHHGMWYARYRMEEFPMVAMFFWRYLNLFALISYLIPLSLYVSLEFVKASQIAYIAKDDHMAIQLPNGDVRYPRPKTSNLNVQLAHVRYIFTDKTGTLTENMMKFVGGYVGGKIFNSVEIPGGLGLELLETVHPSAADLTGRAAHAGAATTSEPAAAAASYHHKHNATTDSSAPSNASTREPTSSTIPPAPSHTTRTSPLTESANLPNQHHNTLIGTENDPTFSLGATLNNLQQTVNDLNQTMLSPLLDDKGAVLLPKDVCMQFAESEVTKLASYRYLLALSLCHNVVCFDPEEPKSVVPPPSSAARRASLQSADPSAPPSMTGHSRPGSSSGLKRQGRKKPAHRTLNLSSMHIRSTSATASLHSAQSMSRVHSRSFSGRVSPVNHGTVAPTSARSHSSTHLHSRGASGVVVVARHHSTSSNPGGGGATSHSILHPSHGALAVGVHQRTISRSFGLEFSGQYQPIFRANPKMKTKIYEGQSLDEVALVEAARENGFQLCHRSLRQIVVDIFGVPVVYEIIAELEFTPQRKLMSIILKRDKSADASFVHACRSYVPPHAHHHSRVTSFESITSGGGGGGGGAAAAVLTARRQSQLHQQAEQHRRRLNVASFEDFAAQPSVTALPHHLNTPPSTHPTVNEALPAIRSSRATAPAHDSSAAGSAALTEFPKIKFDQSTRGGGGRPGDDAADVPSSARSKKQRGGVESPVDESAGVPFGRPNSAVHSPVRHDPFALGGSGQQTPHNPKDESGLGSTVRSAPFSTDDDYLMLTKGADSSMFAVLDPDSMYNKLQRPECETALSEMASTGLRTLVLGYRNLSKAEVDSWLPILHAAQTNEESRDDALHEAYGLIEKKLTIIGTTAVEDKLQDGVPETLQFLLDAEIVIWMLTGDKRETAVTIAATSGLMNPTTDNCMHVDVTQMPMETDEELDRATDEVVRQLEAVKIECFKDDSRVVLVIDGQSLNLILRSPDRAAVFFQVGARCRSAVCCRMTPLQKADIVKLFQENTRGVALAIGDGANDVTMIQESKIGVGIMGLEGSQAELASDFAIPKFRHLKRLLCVHGRNALYRESQCILYSVYKNIVLTCTLATYCYYTAYTGVAMMDSWTLAMWNVFFVSIPPLLLGVFDKDVDDELAETHPQLYAPLAREDMYMNKRAMLTWLIDGVVHGFFMFLLIMVPIGREALHAYYSEPLELGGLTIYIIMVFVCNLQAIGTIQQTNVFNVGGMILSIVIVIVFTLIQSTLENLGGVTEMYHVALDVYGGSYFWIYMVFFNLGLWSIWNVARRYLLRDLWPENNTMVAKIAAQRAWLQAKKRWAEEEEEKEKEREEAEAQVEEKQHQ